MKPPKHKLCGTEHWSTEPCPFVKEVRTKALVAALNQNKLVSDARVLAESQADIGTKPKRRGPPKTTTPEQRKTYLAKKARERRVRQKAERSK